MHSSVIKSVDQNIVIIVFNYEKCTKLTNQTSYFYFMLHFLISMRIDDAIVKNEKKRKVN